MFKIGTERPSIWLDLFEEIRVQIAPYDGVNFAKARQTTIETIGYLPNEDGMAGEWGYAYYMEVAVLVIKGWKGIAAADGKPAEPTPDNIRHVYAFCDGFADDFRRKMNKAYGEADTEKNVFSAAGSGNGPAAAITADDASSSIALAAGESAQAGPMADSAPISPNDPEPTPAGKL